MSDRLVFVGGHGPAQPGIMDPLCASVHCTGFAGYKRRDAHSCHHNTWVRVSIACCAVAKALPWQEGQP